MENAVASTSTMTAAAAATAEPVDEGFLSPIIRKILLADEKGINLLGFFSSTTKETPDKREITEQLKLILEHVKTLHGNDPSVKKALSDWAKHCKADYPRAYKNICMIMQAHRSRNEETTATTTKSSYVSVATPAPDAETHKVIPEEGLKDDGTDMAVSAMPVAVSPLTLQLNQPNKGIIAAIKNFLVGGNTDQDDVVNTVPLVDAPVDDSDIPSNPMELLAFFKSGAFMERDPPRHKKRLIESSETKLPVLCGSSKRANQKEPITIGDDDVADNPLQQLLRFNEQILRESSTKNTDATDEPPAKRRNTLQQQQLPAVRDNYYEISEAKADLDILGISTNQLTPYQRRQQRAGIKTT
jgi:hypothetical protein